MAKSGKARVLTSEQRQHLFDVIKQHRHPEKNAAIMQISFKLGLRAQEISLLRIREVAKVSATGCDFTLKEILALPKSFTKGANAMKRSAPKYERRQISFTVQRFHEILKEVEQAAIEGKPIDPASFYPAVKQHKGNSRDLPMVDPALRAALTDYLRVRLEKSRVLKPNDPLIVTQKGGPYSPNTLQEHMGLMLQRWAAVEKASSHSGRRSLATDVIHKKRLPVKVAQQILGHASAATTIIYEEPPEALLSEALQGLDEE